MNIEQVVGLKYTVVGNGRYRTTKEHDSLVVDTFRNTYYWNSRGEGGSAADFLIRHIGMSKKSAEILATPPLEFEKPKKRLNIEFVNRAFSSGKRDFWYQRGFNDAVINLYKLGQVADVYVVPFFFESNLTAVLLRTPDKFISEVTGSELSLFGWDNLTTDPILFVESPLDVPLLRRFGFNALSHNYGNNVWDDSWTGLLASRDVIFIPDNDPAGMHSVKRVNLSCRVVTWPKITPKGFDMGKLYFSNPDSFIKNVNYLINNAVPIDFIRGFNGNNS